LSALNVSELYLHAIFKEKNNCFVIALLFIQWGHDFVGDRIADQICKKETGDYI